MYVERWLSVELLPLTARTCQRAHPARGCAAADKWAWTRSRSGMCGLTCASSVGWCAQWLAKLRLFHIAFDPKREILASWIMWCSMRLTGNWNALIGRCLRRKRLLILRSCVTCALIKGSHLQSKHQTIMLSAQPGVNMKIGKGLAGLLLCLLVLLGSSVEADEGEWWLGSLPAALETPNSEGRVNSTPWVIFWLVTRKVRLWTGDKAWGYNEP